MYFLNEEQMASWYSLTFQLFSISFNLWPCFQRLFFFWRIGRSSTRGQNIGSSPVSTTSFTHPMNTSTSKKETHFEVWCFFMFDQKIQNCWSLAPQELLGQQIWHPAYIPSSCHNIPGEAEYFHFCSFYNPKKSLQPKKYQGKRYFGHEGTPPQWSNPGTFQNEKLSKNEKKCKNMRKNCVIHENNFIFWLCAK